MSPPRRRENVISRAEIPVAEDRIREIKRRIPIEAVLSERGHDPAHRSSEKLSYRCPLPGHDDRNPSFTVNRETWRCWSQCDRGGDVIHLVVAIAGGVEAIGTLANPARQARQVSP